MHASWGRRAHRLEPDPDTENVVRWMFAQRLAGHSVARIARALNDASIPCPSAADPARNSHRVGSGWSVRTVASILSNPRYAGRQVWNRQPTGLQLFDPADISMGHRQVQRWSLPDGWVISARSAHQELVSEADFIAAQEIKAARGPAPTVPAECRYLLAGLLTCGTCGRRMDSAWSSGRAAYRCRHGHTSAAGPIPGGRGTPTCARTGRSRLPALHLMLNQAELPRLRRRRTRSGVDVRPAVSPQDAARFFRENETVLVYDQTAGTLNVGKTDITESVIRKAS